MNDAWAVADGDKPDPSTIDIPIWVDGIQRLVTGLTKRTTCDDVLYALLYHDGHHEGDTTDNYAIFERWREVERPLQDRTKILKVWKAWGPEQCNVQLAMRKLDDYFLPGEYHRSKRRHRRSRHKTRHSYHCRCHTHKNCYNAGKLKSLEGVVRLVITQERKLQDLGERIEETDHLIDNFETSRHFSRIRENGDDYVQNAYLDSLSEDSMDDFLLNVSAGNMEEYFAFCERIIEIEEKLVHEQSKIQDLTVQINHSVSTDDSLSGSLPNDNASSASATSASAQCEEIQVEINRLVTANMMQRYKEEEVKKELKKYDEQIERKQNIIKSLKLELDSLHAFCPVENENPQCQNGGSSSDRHVDTDDVIGGLQVHTNYPRVKTKSVTFDDTLNHMHVIGTSKENLHDFSIVGFSRESANPVDASNTEVSHRLLRRHPEKFSPGQSQVTVTSILKNRERNECKMQNIDSMKSSYSNVYCTPYNHHTVSDTYKYNELSKQRDYFLPDTMYTYAKDGHYSLLDRVAYKQSRDDNDSNSDTGLSSMHSDESPNCLETLV